MIEIIRRKVKLNQPYAGIFVKRSDENTEEVVKSLEDVYPVGTFAQIVELQDLGTRVRMVLMAHRRIRINDLVKEEPEPVTILTSDDGVGVVDEEAKVSEKQEPPTPVMEDKLFLGSTENVKHNEYETTEEIKAMTQEVIKTIRDIIALNPLYRDSLQQMLQFGQRVVDNPVYLSDLGAALTGGETEELMKVRSSSIVQNPDWTFSEIIFTGTSIVFARFTSQLSALCRSEIISCHLGD